MPQLALRFRGMEALGLTIKWKLKVEHKRRNGRVVAEDTVSIPAAGDNEQQPWHEQTLNGAVEIFAHADWINALQQKASSVRCRTDLPTAQVRRHGIG